MQPVTVSRVYNILKSQASNWCDFADELDIEDEFVCDLEENDELDNEEKLKIILEKWINEEKSDSSWQKIITAAEKLKLSEIASRLKTGRSFSHCFIEKQNQNLLVLLIIIYRKYKGVETSRSERCVQTS